MKKKTVKNISTLLLVFALVLEVAALFRDQVEHYPFIFRIVAPNYIKAVKGVEKLKLAHELAPQDTGFDEISQVFAKRLLLENDVQLVNSISTLRFQLPETPSKLRLTPRSSFMITELKVELSNNQVLDWSLEELNEEVNKLKQQAVFHYAFVLFSIGILGHIVGIILHMKD